MGKRKTTELDMEFAARAPMLLAMVEYRDGHRISPRFDDEEDVVGWSVYDGARLLRGFHTLSQARRFARGRHRDALHSAPAPKFLTAYADSFAA